MGGYLPNAPVNEAAHQFIEKKCSEGKHDKGYMTIPFTTQSWFDPAPGPDPLERLAASGFPVKCETRSWRSISVVLSEELRRPWRRSPKIIQIVELVQLQRNCPDWEGSQSPVPEVR